MYNHIIYNCTIRWQMMSAFGSISLGWKFFFFNGTGLCWIDSLLPPEHWPRPGNSFYVKLVNSNLHFVQMWTELIMAFTFFPEWFPPPFIPCCEWETALWNVEDKVQLCPQPYIRGHKKRQMRGKKREFPGNG
jgi:hypothetical protein